MKPDTNTASHNFCESHVASNEYLIYMFQIKGVGFCIKKKKKEIVWYILFLVFVAVYFMYGHALMLLDDAYHILSIILSWIYIFLLYSFDAFAL